MTTERDRQAYECLGMIEALCTLSKERDGYIARRMREKGEELRRRNANPDLGPMSDVVAKISNPVASTCPTCDRIWKFGAVEGCTDPWHEEAGR